jgi:hypothetical protein
MLRLVVLALIGVSLCAEDSAAVTAFKQAINGDDGVAKREAIRALASKSAGDDWDILPLLVQATGDRQAQQWASEALQARTGLSKPSRGKGGSGYPGFPTTDDGAGWSAWLTGWKKDNEKKKPKAEEQVKPAASTSDSTEAAPVAIAPPPRIPTDDLGKVDRIVYKSGRSLIAFVRAKRLDGDGNLVSVRVVHRDGVGEEVIDASVIARIEEDIE